LSFEKATPTPTMTVDLANEVESSFELPQPTSAKSKSYRYMKYEDVDPKFFPEDILKPQTLCWVLLSKGKGKTPKLSGRARVLSECDKENRVLVEYPSGSTYRVRRSNLMPVLEHGDHLILVASETNDYRRTAIVHTREEDHFVEIGCDFGILVDSVDTKSRLGVDKSEESIRIAKERYPNREFLLRDVFEDSDIPTLQQPLVVAIDINGNRLLPAVLKCVQLAMDSWSPRLIIVKSRELYAKMVKEQI
jgi:hypothetical protein